MLSTATLAAIAEARFEDANALLSANRYDGAVYLCGYALEIALKARIVKTLKWEGFPQTDKEFRPYRSFRSHDLDVLLHLSGRESEIKATFLSEWSVVKSWNPELRYTPPGKANFAKANDIIKSTRKLIAELL
jgi:hypothetical protein